MFSFAVALALAASSALVAGSPAPADDCGTNPYTGTPPSYTQIKSPGRVERGERARIVVRVGTYGNLGPTGRMTVKVSRRSGGFRWQDARKYDGAKVRFRTPVLVKRGKYVIEAKFDADPGPCVHDSDNRASFRVVRPG